MKRVKRSRETTTSSHPPPYLTRSKQRKENDETDPLSIIPSELKTEILMKLPARDITKLMFVSKPLSSTVLSKDFIELFVSQSVARPRFLFTFITYSNKLIFHSLSQEGPNSEPHRASITTTPGKDPWYRVIPPVNGLICCRNFTKVLICNPSTGQLLTLPRIRTWRKGIWTFFGYDPVNNQYKLLSMTVKRNLPYNGDYDSDEHQVFTLGGQKTWRMIKCTHQHRPYRHTKGICSNGVVYYLAWTNYSISLVSFDLGSEEFNVIELPETGHPHDTYYELLNFNGKIALVRGKYDGSPSKLWVLEDATKQEWLKFSALFPAVIDLIVSEKFEFRGAISTGEIIFAPPRTLSYKSFYVLCYNVKENKVRKVEIEGPQEDVADFIVFPDYIESLMLLPRKLIR